MTDKEQKEITIVRRIRNPTTEFSLRSDGIIMAVTPDYVDLNISNTKLFPIALREITHGVPHAVLTVPGKHMTVDKEARSYFASAEALQDVLALASIVSSTVHRVVGNLFHR